MVLLIHVFGQILISESTLIGSFQWNIANIIDSISRCSVPLFFMLSGALLLNKKLDTKRFLLGRLKKVAIPFVFWSLIYSLFNRYYFKNEAFNLKKVIRDIFHGSEDHLWFIFVLLGLYLIAPLISGYLRKKNDLIFFIVLWFMATTLSFLGFTHYLPKIDVTYFYGYIGYFVLGYYLSRNPFSNLLSGILLIIGLTVTILFTYLSSVSNGFFVHKFYGYLTPNVIIVSIAIFSFLTRIEIRKTITKKIFFQLSKLSFGIYLSHMLFLSFLLEIKVNYFTSNGLFDSIVIFFFCFICSIGITWIMKKMPLLKRFV